MNILSQIMACIFTLFTFNMVVTLAPLKCVCVCVRKEKCHSEMSGKEIRKDERGGNKIRWEKRER